jgi:hypothetical protein
MASLYTEGGAVELDRRPRVGIAAEDLEPQLLKKNFESVHCTCFINWKWQGYMPQQVIRREAILLLGNTLT